MSDVPQLFVLVVKSNAWTGKGSEPLISESYQPATPEDIARAYHAMMRRSSDLTDQQQNTESINV